MVMYIEDMKKTLIVELNNVEVEMKKHLTVQKDENTRLQKLITQLKGEKTVLMNKFIYIYYHLFYYIIIIIIFINFIIIIIIISISEIMNYNYNKLINIENKRRSTKTGSPYA